MREELRGGREAAETTKSRSDAAARERTGTNPTTAGPGLVNASESTIPSNHGKTEFRATTEKPNPEASERRFLRPAPGSHGPPARRRRGRRPNRTWHQTTAGCPRVSSDREHSRSLVTHNTNKPTHHARAHPRGERQGTLWNEATERNTERNRLAELKARWTSTEPEAPPSHQTKGIVNLGAAPRKPHTNNAR